MKTSLLREKLQEKISDLEFSKKSLKSSLLERKRLEKDLKVINETRSLIILASQATQNKLENHLSDIVTLALKTVFGDSYSFKIKFVQRRNTTEADLILVENGRETNPIYSDGFGLCDVISLALRIGYWKLQNSRNVIIWDEPLRFLSKDLHDLVSVMIKQISEKLNLQFIIITHNTSLTNNADKLFLVEKGSNLSNNCSKVSILKEEK